MPERVSICGAHCCFPREVIAHAVRLDLRFALSDRDLEDSCWPSVALR